MVGNGIQSNNAFTVLDALRKKKKSNKSKGSSKASSSAASVAQEKEQQSSQVLWPSTSLAGTSWADVDDDDDYYATTAPPKAMWATSEPEQKGESSGVLEVEEDSELEVDYGDEDIEDEPEHEPDIVEPVLAAVENTTRAPAPPREAERQLSKKQLRLKELAELDAVIAELGLDKKDSNDNIADEKEKQEQPTKDMEVKENISSAQTEGKTSKKKKKKDKDKAPKDKDSQKQTNGTCAPAEDEATISKHAGEENSMTDTKERLKKMASIKKKKSTKEMDSSAKAAVTEAAARSAKLAAAKKKEKNHYNQQPVR